MFSFKKNEVENPKAIDRDFAQKLLKCFDDPDSYGVHQLFNDWWKAAPDEVLSAYEADFDGNPKQRAFFQSKHFAKKTSLKTLKEYAPGTLGRGFHDFLVDNGLEENIARNYKMLHTAMKLSGKLNRMSPALQYQVVRGFQIHDLLHVLTGYEATPEGEIALQAFCLSQIRFPYFAMWMSVITTRIALIEPEKIDSMMTAISDGWAYGKAAQNIQFERWEDVFDAKITDLRERYDLERSRPFEDVLSDFQAASHAKS